MDRMTTMAWLLAVGLTHCGTPAPPDAAASDGPDVSGAPDVPAGDTSPEAEETDSHHDAASPDTRADGDVDAGPRMLRTIHGCDPAGNSVVDLTTDPMPTIVSGPTYVFSPGCTRVRVGQRVRFVPAATTTWTIHPLAAGEIAMDTEIPDPTSPIPLREEGTDPVDVTFTQPGSYGYYCTRHWLAGHVGTLHVVP